MKILNLLKKGLSFILGKMSGVIKKYPELLSIPTGFVIWWLLKSIISVDPENAPLDDGIFMIIPFTLIQITIYLSMAWMFLGVIFGTFRKYMTIDMKDDFKTLTKWQKVKLSYFIFFALLFSIVALSTALL